MDVGEVELIVPQVVVDEFRRNRDRVIADARRSLQSHFRLVREAVSRFANAEHKTDTLKGLDEVDHRIVTEPTLKVTKRRSPSSNTVVRTCLPSSRQVCPA